VFLEAWFNLTHDRSLESYRVRCHNGRTILAELDRELVHPFASPDDIAMIAAEAKEICTCDHELQLALGGSWPILASLLEKVASKPKKEGEPSGKEATQLAYVLTDTLSALPDSYLTKVIAALEVAVTGAQDAEIVRLAACLASELAARGWAVASLHSWVQTTFLANPPSGEPFLERFRFFARRVQQPRQLYEVVICLSGSSDLQKLGDFCGYRFSPTPPVVADYNLRAAQSLTKFLRLHPLRTYASTTLKAVDRLSAAHAALEAFAKCQDRLRFNFSPEPVLNDGQRLLITRLADQKQRLVPVVFGLPRPEHHLPLGPFLAANRRLDELFGSNQLDNSSLRRIEAAARHYRLGLEGLAYHDMLLHWWMGLETLTNSGDGKGGIGGKVVGNAVPLLTHRYFALQLRSLARLVGFTCRNWPTEVTNLVGGPPAQKLNWTKIVTVLQDAGASKAVADALDNHPWVRNRWLHFQELSTVPLILAGYLSDHERLVHWHLHRLYRIRCCLVHGTPVLMPLQLPAANLEYYLREAIYVVLIALGRASQLKSLEVLFARAQYCSMRRKAILTGPGANAKSIRATLETDLTFQICP